VVKTFSIAGITLSLEYSPGQFDVILDEPLHNAFAIDPVDAPDIRFVLDTESPFPRTDGYRRIFTSAPEGLWTMYDEPGGRGYLITLQNVDRDPEPYAVIRSSGTFDSHVIFRRPNSAGNVFPLEYPTDELIFSSYLNLNGIGVILHSACVSVGGGGMLFSGTSGAGKSTLSQLWQDDPSADVLTDERVVVREKEGRPWAYGTPWHGTARMHRNAGVPIERVFFIKHGRENRATRIARADAAQRLMVRCFPTFWHKKGMAVSLEKCTDLAESVEAYELEFVPDRTVCEYVKSFHV